MRNEHYTEVPSRVKRVTRSLGLVLVGTAALSLGGLPGCKDDRSRSQPGSGSGKPTTRSTRGYVGGGAYVAGARAGTAANGTRSAAADGQDTQIRRGGFGSSARGAGS